MKTQMTFLVAVGITIFSCGTNRDSGKDEISGTYVREYSFKVENPESSAEVGTRTIRDSIFIRSMDKHYEISNNKWQRNDYDREGWKNMEHSEDRPMVTYEATFDPSKNSLQADSRISLYFDFNTNQLFKGEKKNAPYLGQHKIIEK